MGKHEGTEQHKAICKLDAAIRARLQTAGHSEASESEVARWLGRSPQSWHMAIQGHRKTSWSLFHDLVGEAEARLGNIQFIRNRVDGAVVVDLNFVGPVPQEALPKKVQTSGAPEKAADIIAWLEEQDASASDKVALLRAEEDNRSRPRQTVLDAIAAWQAAAADEE